MKRNTVLLVFADPVLFPSAQPYGATILAGRLAARGIRAEVILPFMRLDPAEAVREAYGRIKPRIVGFSFRNLDTAGFHYEDDGEETFLDDLREVVGAVPRSDSILVVGGAGFGIAPKQILNFTAADVGFVGPSEADFAEFCVRVIQRGAALEQAVVGLTSAFTATMPAPSPQQHSLSPLACFDLAAVEYARMVGGTVPVRTKSGCSLRCTYCVVPSIEKLVLRPWGDIRRELQSVHDAGLGDRVFIADGEFNLPSVEHAVGLCRCIRDEFGSSINWRCYLEAGYVTPELLAAMAESGCVGISLTVDSLSDATRRGYAKGSRASVAFSAMELCLASGIQTRINLLFGGPNESLESALETAHTARDFNQRGIIVAVTIGLRVYPGTPFAKLVKLPHYALHYCPCKTVDWLGVFCSPVPANELVKHIKPVLPPPETIPYTNTVRRSDKGFYHEVALGTNLLIECRFAEAEAYFQKLEQKYPERREPKLGILKARYGLAGEDVPREVGAATEADLVAP